MKSKSFTGITGPAGELNFFNFGSVRNFLSNFPEKRILIEIQILEPEVSKNLLGYYSKVIVPAFQEAFREKLGERMSLQAVEETLRGFYPGSRIEVFVNKGFETERLKDVTEFSNREMVDYIEHLRHIASVEFDLIIEEPN